MANDELEEQRKAAVPYSAVPAKRVETIPVAENHANYLVDKITNSDWVRDLGKKGKVSVPMKAAIAYAVAATLEELHASDRTYRVADLNLFARIAAYFNPSLRPVSISVSATAGATDPGTASAEKSGGFFGKLSWSEYALIITALCTAGAVYYAQHTSGQITSLQGAIAAKEDYINSLKGLLKNAETKRDEYADDLVEVNHYVGKLEGQTEGQTEQQKTMLREMRAYLSKVDKIIQDKNKSQSKTGSGTTKN